LAQENSATWLWYVPLPELANIAHVAAETYATKIKILRIIL
jgi:hypothetical protein